ncbi:hypothetical protein GF314_08680 [bacterium]|nr:hypothetical protein [bacterium]
MPTMENVARQLLDDAMPLFGDLGAELVACHLTESPDREATAYRDGSVEAHHWLAWSAVRRTMAPDLTTSENAAYFGEAATHDRGHRYRLRVTLGGDRDPDTGLLAPLAVVEGATATLRDDLAHRHLTHEVPALKGRPTTNESLVRWLDVRLGDTLPIARLRLFEGPDRFAEHHPDGGTRIGLERWFDAAHRLHSPHLDDAENHRVYGKCNNPSGHGHTYRIEATLAAPYDERSGTVGDFTALRQGMDAAVEPWHDHHLDLETDDFRDRPSTSENILQVLWPRLGGSLRGQLSRVRLWETENNRFALRRKVESGALAAG